MGLKTDVIDEPAHGGQDVDVWLKMQVMCGKLLDEKLLDES